MIGTSGDDLLVDTPGSHVICGLGGNDIIVGGDGDDAIWGDSPSTLQPSTVVLAASVATTAAP